MKVSVVNVDQNACVEIPDARSLYDAVAQSVALFRADRREITLEGTDRLWICTDDGRGWTVSVAGVIRWAEARRGEELADRLLAELRDVR